MPWTHLTAFNVSLQLDLISKSDARDTVMTCEVTLIATAETEFWFALAPACPLVGLHIKFLESETQRGNKIIIYLVNLFFNAVDFNII